MKVFLTGESGILGNDIKKELEIRGDTVRGFNSQNIAIADYEDVKSKMEIFKPDLVIHAAAMTNVDLCEDDQDAANAINITGTKNIANAALATGAKLVYISSCGVYGNGKKTPYSEIDDTTPQTFHHKTKLEGEKWVTTLLKNYLIIRPGWLFGGTPQHKKNFVDARRREAGKSPQMSSAADKVGSPTYTLDLTKQILALVDNDLTGIFNVVNEGCASRYEYVKAIIELSNLNVMVNPVNSNEFPRKANMPDNECLENKSLNDNGVNIMRNWKEALKEYIEHTYNI